MKEIDENLAYKFGDIADLPVSEELLGAYLEGGLHGSEFREVQSCIQESPSASALVDVVGNDYMAMDKLGLSDFPELEPLFGSDDMFADFSLPEISSFGIELLIDPSSPLTEDIIIGGGCHGLIGGEDIHIHSDNIVNSHHDPSLDFGGMDND